MDDFYIYGYRIHVSIKIPHLFEELPNFSYQFVIYNRIGKMMNYPFSRIIAKNDLEFKSILIKDFKDYINRDDLCMYPTSKFIKELSQDL